MNIHAAGATDNGRARLRIHASKVMQTNQGGVFGADRLIGRADFENRTRNAVIDVEVAFAIEAFFAGPIAGLHAQDADVAASPRRETAGPD